MAFGVWKVYLKQAIKLFLENCERRELSPHTLRAYELDLSDFEVFCVNKTKVDLLNPNDLREWVDHLRRRGLSASSRKRHLASLKVFCRWMEEEEIISVTPFQGFRLNIKLPRRLPRNINRAQLQILFDAIETIDQSHGIARQTLRVALEVLITTGLRISELCNIKLEDIDFEASTIRVSGKGARERSVFILEEDLKELLRFYIHRRNRVALDDEFLLTTPKGGKASPDFLRRMLHKFSKEIGLSQRLTPHMFRHSAATLLLENGVDIRFVQRLLGHASLSTTEIYTHVTENSLKAALSEGNIRKKIKNA